MNNEDTNKFEQVFLYVLSKVGGKPNVGETVLHKLMYFIDFDYFEKHGVSITGVQYKRNHHGPTFDSSLINNLISNKSITCIKDKYKGYPQKRYIANVDYDLSVFTAREIKHIDEVLAKHSDKTATQIENYSHRDIPWKITEENNIIEYESVFYRDDNYSVRNDDLDDPI